MRRSFFKSVSVFYAVLAYIFLYLPIIIVIVFSFNTSERNIQFEGFTLSWYPRIFQNEDLIWAFKNTMITAISSTLIATILGTLCAFGIYRFDFRLKKILNGILYIPIVIPELVFAIAVLAFFSLINIDMNIFTLIISHVTFSLPFVVITVRSALNGMDPSLEEAARDLKGNLARHISGSNFRSPFGSYSFP